MREEGPRSVTYPAQSVEEVFAQQPGTQINVEFIAAPREVDPPSGVPAECPHGAFPDLGIILLQATNVLLRCRETIEGSHVPFALRLQKFEHVLVCGPTSGGGRSRGRK